MSYRPTYHPLDPRNEGPCAHCEDGESDAGRCTCGGDPDAEMDAAAEAHQQAMDACAAEDAADYYPVAC